MSGRGRYMAPPSVKGVTKVYQKGKTQVPSEIRKVLHLKDGDRLVWYDEGGRVFVKRLE